MNDSSSIATTIAADMPKIGRKRGMSLPHLFSHNVFSSGCVDATTASDEHLRWLGEEDLRRAPDENSTVMKSFRKVLICTAKACLASCGFDTATCFAHEAQMMMIPNDISHSSQISCTQQLHLVCRFTSNWSGLLQRHVHAAMPVSSTSKGRQRKLLEEGAMCTLCGSQEKDLIAHTMQCTSTNLMGALLLAFRELLLAMWHLAGDSGTETNISISHMLSILDFSAILIMSCESSPPKMLPLVEGLVWMDEQASRMGFGRLDWQRIWILLLKVFRKMNSNQNPESLTESCSVLLNRILVEWWMCAKHCHEQTLGQSLAVVGRYEILAPINKGAYGSVYLARHIHTRGISAIKVMSKEHIVLKNNVRSVATESLVLQRSQHPCVVRLLEAFQSSHHLYLVMEFLPGGDLSSLIHAVGVLDEDSVRSYGSELIGAVKYLHREGIIHRDIKPDNILIDKTGHIKLSDFGLARQGAEKACEALKLSVRNRRLSLFTPRANNAYFATKQPHWDSHYRHQRAFSFMTAPYRDTSIIMENEISDGTWAMPITEESMIVGTPNYMAPELVTGQHQVESGSEWESAVDYWSTGVVMYEMLEGQPPFYGDSVEKVFEQIAVNEPTRPLDISDEAWALVLSLLVQPLAQRKANWDCIEKLEFFSGVCWNDLRGSEPPFVPQLSHDTDISYFYNRSLSDQNNNNNNSTGNSSNNNSSGCDDSNNHKDDENSNDSNNNNNDINSNNTNEKKRVSLPPILFSPPISPMVHNINAASIALSPSALLLGRFNFRRATTPTAASPCDVNIHTTITTTAAATAAAATTTIGQELCSLDEDTTHYHQHQQQQQQQQQHDITKSFTEVMLLDFVDK